jgi:Dolichyl-phosphate-mannose-protein mannosyltransferase
LRKSSEFSASDRSEHRLRWALGAVMLWRLLFPYFDSPLAHLFSDPARHWANAARFLDPDVIGAGDPYLYQLWLYLVRTLSADDPATVILSCGLLCAAMPYGWYRALRELLPRKAALAGAVTIGLVPGFFGIYAYFMNETLLLTLSGFAFWFTFRAWRKATLAAWALACGLWTCAIFTRPVALPMALACLAAVWVGQPRRLERAVIAVASFGLLAVPAGMHGYTKLGFFAPLGNVHLSEIYSLSGNKNIDLDVGAAGHWGFGSPSFYNPTFFPLANWTTARQGTVAVKVDLAHGRSDWIAERERVRRESPIGRWQRYKENSLYLLFGQSWPDNDPHALSGRLTVWTRWVWPPLMLYVLWGVWQRRFLGRAWLLPACSLGMLLFLALQGTGIVEGRYVKPLHPILLAAAVVFYASKQRSTGRSSMFASNSAFFDYPNTTAWESAERTVPQLNARSLGESLW